MIDASPLIRHEVVLGRSEHGRPIVAWEMGDPNAKRRVLAVGCIHGNEPTGIAIANAVSRARVPAGTFPGTTAFVVELPAGPVPAARLGVFTRAILS